MPQLRNFANRIIQVLENLLYINFLILFFTRRSVHCLIQGSLALCSRIIDNFFKKSSSYLISEYLRINKVNTSVRNYWYYAGAKTRQKKTIKISNKFVALVQQKRNMDGGCFTFEFLQIVKHLIYYIFIFISDQSINLLFCYCQNCYKKLK